MVRKFPFHNVLEKKSIPMKCEKIVTGQHREMF